MPHAPAAISPIRRALLSVSDKSGLVELGRMLHARGVELISTGGTARALRDARLPVREVEEVTGFPEMMDGRVKTLHPRVHGGLLARRDDADHMAAAKAHAVPLIDLLVVNLYPFEATVAGGADVATCIENIDIGGPAMIRAAAKNHAFVAVITDPADYAPLIQEIEAHEGGTTPAFRRELALTAFGRTAAYDAAVSSWLAEETGTHAPAYRAMAGRLDRVLRYGENPHQGAALYRGGPPRPGAASATQLQGKALSYNNLGDTDAAFELVAEFADEAACAIIKHGNPCGVGTGATLAEAYRQALACDPQSAFGGIVALSRPLDDETAAEIAGHFTEVVIAPGVAPSAARTLAGRHDLRLLDAGALPDATRPVVSFHQLAGGFLTQDSDAAPLDEEELRPVTKRQPTAEEIRDLLFAWKVAKHVRSNAIVLAANGATIGIGAGQMSRVDAARMAAWKADAAREAGVAPEDCVVASDAFFPFADALELAARAGARAVIQPGGSRNDAEVIAAADRLGLAMVFTGRRHFRH